jgi:hypothetical protein
MERVGKLVVDPPAIVLQTACVVARIRALAWANPLRQDGVNCDLRGLPPPTSGAAPDPLSSRSHPSTPRLLAAPPPRTPGRWVRFLPHPGNRAAKAAAADVQTILHPQNRGNVAVGDPQLFVQVTPKVSASGPYWTWVVSPGALSSGHRPQIYWQQR